MVLPQHAGFSVLILYISMYSKGTRHRAKGIAHRAENRTMNPEPHNFEPVNPKPCLPCGLSAVVSTVEKAGKKEEGNH
jgi:hypothetical protein